MPFVDTNNPLTTKPSNFDIKCQSNCESYNQVLGDFLFTLGGSYNEREYSGADWMDLLVFNLYADHQARQSQDLYFKDCGMNYLRLSTSYSIPGYLSMQTTKLFTGSQRVAVKLLIKLAYNYILQYIILKYGILRFNCFNITSNAWGIFYSTLPREYRD